MTPILRISDSSKAIEFYVEWLGFHLDWAELADGKAVYLQTSRDDAVLHLVVQPGEQGQGASARAEIRGLPAYHYQLLSKQNAFGHPCLKRASWDNRVLEMEVVDPFGNRILFCEPTI